MNIKMATESIDPPPSVFVLRLTTSPFLKSHVFRLRTYSESTNRNHVSRDFLKKSRCSELTSFVLSDFLSHINGREQKLFRATNDKKMS